MKANERKEEKNYPIVLFRGYLSQFAMRKCAIYITCLLEKLETELVSPSVIISIPYEKSWFFNST